MAALVPTGAVPLLPFLVLFGQAPPTDGATIRRSRPLEAPQRSL